MRIRKASARAGPKEKHAPPACRPVGRHAGGAQAWRGYRYWPVLAIVSIERPVSPPRFPVTSVRMKTIRSPFLPEMRAQSSGLVVLGRSSFSLNSSTQAPSRWEMRRPFCLWSRKSLIADFFARSTMFWIIAPELKSRKYMTSLSPLA